MLVMINSHSWSQVISRRNHSLFCRVRYGLFASSIALMSQHDQQVASPTSCFKVLRAALVRVLLFRLRAVREFDEFAP
jgi:hypothetical protein